MKKNNVIMWALIIVFSTIKADPIITFFFQPLNDFSTLNDKLKKPGKLAKYTVRGIIQPAPIAGILATYGGYITASNYNGAVLFPRKHQKSIITFVVTPEITPISLFESTLLQWRLVPGVDAKMYTCEQKYNDEKKYYYWNVEESSLPEDRMIPLSAIVIIAKPKNIVMTLGQTITSETANLVLPDIYVKKGIDIVKNSIYMLNIRHLFKVVNFQETYEQLKIITHIID